MSRLLKKDIAQLISLRDLFPRAQPNFKTGLTNYQEKKIRAALKEIHKLDDYKKTSRIVPMGRGRKEYLKENNLPEYLRGIPLPGGKEVNKKLTYTKEGSIKYERAGKTIEQQQINLSSEEALKKSTAAILKNRGGRLATLTFFGKAIGAVRPTDNNKIILKEALYYYNKYVEKAGKMVRGKDMRGRPKYTRLPKHWEMGVLFEEKPTRRKTNERKGKKKAH